MTEIVYKEVKYDEYCGTCKHKNDDPGTEPCNECLMYFVNINSSKPVHYEEED